jgi:arginine decarboxylase
MVPKKAFITTGIGKSKTELQSFEDALRNAGIEKQNLVYVSSILPPNCEIISKEDGLKLLQPGQITFCVMSKNHTDENKRLVGASVGIAVPSCKEKYGYISEYHSFGKDEKLMGDISEDLASSMLATTLNIKFDPDKDYDERKDIYLMDGKIINSDSFPCIAYGEKGFIITVISSVVFIL